MEEYKPFDVSQFDSLLNEAQDTEICQIRIVREPDLITVLLPDGIAFRISDERAAKRKWKDRLWLIPLTLSTASLVLTLVRWIFLS